jgi:hypothetical protein
MELIIDNDKLDHSIESKTIENVTLDDIEQGSIRGSCNLNDMNLESTSPMRTRPATWSSCLQLTSRCASPP